MQIFGQAPPRTLLAAGIAAMLAASAALVPFSAASAAAPEDPASWVVDPASYVDPMIGTTNAGNTYPGAVAPFGMLAWSPDQNFYNGPTSGANAGKGTLRTPSPSGYEYNRNTIRGFGLTHVSGAGCAGLSGDLPFFPVPGDIEVSPSLADTTGAPFQSTFSHANETATAGAYSVGLDNGVDVSLSATTRAGVGSFTYPADQAASMLVRTSDSLVGSSDADVTIDADSRTISGSVTSGNFCGPFTGDGILQRSYYTVYFTATFDAPFTEHGTWVDAALQPGSTAASGGTGYTAGRDSSGNVANGYPAAGKGSGAYVTFDTAEKQEVNVRVGISYVSVENAAENLAAEIPADTSIAQVQQATHDDWNEQLERAKIAGGTDDERTTFYSSLYRSLLHPNITSDVDREYTGFDLATHEVPEGQDAQYATFSGWDVYRSQLQLVTLLDPKRGADIAASLLNQADQNDGVWDRWTHNSGAVHVMVGDPSPIALAGIYAFGGTDFPVERAYDSLAQAARVPTALDLSRRGWNVAVEGQRPSLDQFLEHGYYPEGCNAWGCPNETLEMSASDYGLASLAAALGKDDDYDEFVARSQSWQNQFNSAATPQGGYIQGRMADGTWAGGFNPASSNGFVEGTGAQYVWMVQHNPAGLFDAMGGRDKAVSRLDAFFKDGSGAWKLTGPWDNNVHANMDNEPSIATPWLYNYAGVPSKTQETVRQTIRQLWLDTLDGVPNGPDGIPGNDDLGQMSSWLVFAAMGLYPENPSQAELTVAAPLFPAVEVHRANGVTLSLSAPGANVDTPYITGMSVDGEPTTATYLGADAITRDTSVDFSLSATPNTTWGTGEDDAPPSFRDGERPYLASLSASSTTTSPGGLTGAVTLSVQKFAASAPGPVTFTVEAPDGFVPSVDTGTVELDAQMGTGTVPITLRAPSDAELGSYPVTVHLTAGDLELADQTFQVEVTEQTSTILQTSFEAGQLQAVPNVRLENTGFGDYCCSIGGVETKVQSGDADTGSQAVIYSARAMQQDAHASNVILDVDQPVAGGESLSYSVRPQENGGPFGDYVQNASQFVALDLLFTDGSRLSQTGVVASNGAALDALAQGGVLDTDTWNDVRVTLPASVAGKTIDEVLLSFSTGNTFTDGGQNGYLRGWVDDVALTAPVTPLDVVGAEGLTAQAGTELSDVVAHFTGGAGASAADFTSTIDWGDGSEPATATVTASADGGYDVVGAHTYAETGTYGVTVTVADADDVRKSITVTVEVAAAGVEVAVTAVPRCIAGKAMLAVVGTNHDGGPVDILLETPYGSHTFPAVADGKAAYQTFNARSVNVPAGTATITASAADGRQEVYTVDYSALSCG